MRASYLKKFILAVLFLSLAACSTGSYHKSMRRWTRSHNLYSYETLAANILWHATYLSSEYRSIAQAKINEWECREPNDLGNYPNYLSETEDGTFLISIYLPRAYPSIANEADNFWEFTLNLPSGEALVPTSVESVHITPREQKLFPYINRWSRFYRVRFPVSHLERPFTLILRSAGATSMLEWN